jgi:uncharacterized protein (TIRG00374 family)
MLTIVWALVRFGGFGLVEFRWVLGQPLLVAAAVLSVWASLLFAALRFRLILRQQGVSQDFLSLVAITSASVFSANVLLGAIGGDGIRYLLLAPRSEAQAVATLTAIALDRILGLLGLVAIGLVALFLRLDLVFSSLFVGHVALVGSAAVLAVAAVTAAFFGGRASARVAAWIVRRLPPGRLARIVQALGRSMALIAADPRRTLLGFGLSVIAQLFPLVGFYAVAVMLPHMTLSALDFAFAMPAGLLANSLSITPGGLGAGEGAFEFLARIVSPETTISFAALFFSFRVIGAAALLPGIVPLLIARASPAGPTVASSRWKAGAERP